MDNYSPVNESTFNMQLKPKKKNISEVSIILTKNLKCLKSASNLIFFREEEWGRAEKEEDRECVLTAQSLLRGSTPPNMRL